MRMPMIEKIVRTAKQTVNASVLTASIHFCLAGVTPFQFVHFNPLSSCVNKKKHCKRTVPIRYRFRCTSNTLCNWPILSMISRS